MHPNFGGAEISTHEHAKAWVKAGHSVYWFSAFFKGCKKKEKIDGVNLVRTGWQFFDVQIKALFWYFFGKHPKFNLVVDQFHGLPFFTPLYVGVKKLAFIHEVAKEVWRLNPWPRPFNLIPAVLGPILEPLIFVFYKSVPFMTVSESTRKDLISWGIPNANVTVIQNGINPPKVFNGSRPKEKRNTLIYLGAISKDKGIEDAFLAFSEILKIDKNWQFWVAGKASEDYLKWMERASKDLDFGNNFKYWGFVGEEKKFELLARAQLLINPSAHEGWGLVNIEASFVGTPVVGYDVHGVRDSVKDGETGFLCPRGEYRSLAQNSLKLVADSRQYERFRINCINWSKKFSWQKATHESLQLIESI